MSSFLKKIVLVLVPVMLMAGFNLRVDPQMLFNKRPLHRVVGELKREKVAECYSDFDEREFRRLLLKARKGHHFDVVVLGSSRAMTISGEALPTKKILNLAVSGASLEDLLALWMLVEENVDYDTVLLALDPWILNPEHGDIRWKTLASNWKAALNRLNLPVKGGAQTGLWQAKVKELFSPLYFRDSVVSLRESKKSILGVQEDGSILYRTPPPTFQESKGQIYKLSPFPNIDELYLDCLKAWLETLQASGKRVVVWLPPFRPDTYGRLREESDYRMFRQSEASLRQLCEELGLQTLGSYDPESQRFGNEDFWDGIHLMPEKVTEFLEQHQSEM